MTFLNPLVLIGLAAAAIPVLLHLLNLRKLRIIEFSTLSFLKELQQSKIRKLKLRQLLLLIIRTLLIVFIVLAFARPALRGTLLGTIGSNAHSTVIFILDDSFSMSARNERGELLNQAKETLARLSGLLRDGDEAHFIRLSELPAATIDPATHDFRMLRTVISESALSEVRRPVEDAFRLAARLLATSRNANKEVYLVSDLQRTLFPDALREGTSPGLSLFDPDVRFFLHRLGSGENPNTSVDSVGIATTILERDKPVEINALIRNFGKTPVNNNVMSVFFDKARMAQANIHADPWGSAPVTFRAAPKRSGTVQGFVELEQDAIDIDNRRYFTMEVPENITVTHIEGTPGEGMFPTLALSAGSESRSLFELRKTTLNNFSQLDLIGVDVIMITGIRMLTSADAERIRSFIEQGGGLILFPGSIPDIANLNMTLLRALGIPPIQGIASGENTQSQLSFRDVDLDHPIFNDIFERTSAGARTPSGVESPSILTTVRRQAGREARTIISLSDGSPFLTEHTLGRGKILFFSVAPVIRWSDFPLKGVFAPLVHRSAVYVASHGERPTGYRTGEAPNVRVHTTAFERGISPAGRQYMLISPRGMTEIVRPLPSSIQGSGPGGSVTFQLPMLTTSGCYEIRSGEILLSTFAVNTDPLESDGRTIADDELDFFWQSLGISAQSVHTLEATEEMQASVMQSRYGTELWKYCLGIALLLALIEMAVARDSRKAAGQPAT